MSESESDEQEKENNKKRKLISSRPRTKYLQKYNEFWEQLGNFKNWVGKSKKGSSFAYCKICDVDLNIANSGKSALEKHLNSNSHKTACSSISKNQPVVNFNSTIKMDTQVGTF